MMGAIVGDIAGSTREFNPIKTKEFSFFEAASTATDDSVLTLAVATAILDGADFGARLAEYARAYPTSYGHSFYDWALKGGGKPYGSWGNGAAMRASSCAWLAGSLAEAMDLASRSAAATHDHPEGIRGARATVLAVYLARAGWKAADIRAAVSRASGYDLSASVDEIREGCVFEVKSWISVPQAIVCALEAQDFEDAVRNAVSLGGDADTQAAIAGSIAEAMFGVPAWMEKLARQILAAWQLAPALERALAAVLPVADPSREAALLPPFDPAETDAWNAKFRPPEPPPREFDWAYFMSEPPRPLSRRLSDRLRRLFGLGAFH